MDHWTILVSIVLGAVAGWVGWWLYVTWPVVSSGELAAIAIGAVVGAYLGSLLAVGRDD